MTSSLSFFFFLFSITFLDNLIQVVFGYIRIKLSVVGQGNPKMYSELHDSFFPIGKLRHFPFYLSIFYNISG